MPGPDTPLARPYFLLYSGIATIPKGLMDPREVISTKPPRRIPLFFHLKWSTKAIDLAPWPAQQPLITLTPRMERPNDLLDVLDVLALCYLLFFFLFFFCLDRLGGVFHYSFFYA